MGFFDKLRGEFVDIIEWLDPSNDTLVYRFPRYQNEIKNGAKLTVREGQVAVFINEGAIADIFLPGMYALTTANLPVLSTLKGWKYGFDSPFKAEVYFVSTRNITAQKWGTKNPIILNDARYGLIEMRAYGTYIMRIKDAGLFIKEIVGTDGHFTADKIAEQLKSMIVARVTDAAGESNLAIENYASNISEVSELVYGIVGPQFEKYGVGLTELVIENISMPEEVKKEIFELSRLNAIDLNKFTQIKAAKAIEVAADNDMGISGAGLGMGMAMSNMMGQIFNNNQPQQTRQQQTGAPGGMPPPLPQALTFFAVINGQQAGPYDMAALQQMTLQNLISRDTLVWYNGMANWTMAGQVQELHSLFGAVPPPIPGI